MNRGLGRRFFTAAVVAAIVSTYFVGWAAPPAGATVFANTTPLTIADADCPNISGTANVYPSNIVVSGMSGTVTDVNVTLSGVSYPFEGDLEVLLVGPSGGAQNIVLLSDAGTGTLTNATINVDDAASAQAPQGGSWGAGSGTVSTIKPTNYTTLNENAWPAPAPAPSSTTTLATAFNGINPNGTWSLYVVDDGCDTDPLGTLANGWSLDISAGVAAQTATAVGSSLNPSRTGQSVTFTATVASGGTPVTTGTVTFSEGPTTLAANVPLDGSGQAVFSTAALVEGDHLITATYNGTASFATSNGSVNQRVDNNTVVTNSTFCNPGAITVPTAGAGFPYPSNVFVTGFAGTLATATVQLKNVTHGFAGDIELLLVGPGGGSQNLVLVSDAGTAAASDVTITLDDSAASFLPATGGWSSGTFKPTNNASGPADAFPAPAPAPSSATTLQGAFNSISPNGTWSLYAVDDAGGDVGTIAGGWCVTLIPKALPTLTTQASGTVAVGGSITDTATVSGGSSPTGTVSFTLFGPNDATCTGAPVFTSADRPLVAGSATSASFSPSTAGTYRWIASYSGDANNSPVTGTCNDANESVVVSQAVPTLTTTASGTVAVGGQISDAATLAGGFNPTGTVTFTLFGPDNPTCTGAPVFTSNVDVTNGNGNYGSTNFTTTAAGTYNWVAAYSGDANNTGATSPCGAANESVVVTQAVPTLTTTASGTVAVGGQISDAATLAGGFNPSGTVTFTLFGPDNPTCTGAPIFTSIVNVANSAASSANFTTTATGTYNWVAVYSGDASNTGATSPCGAANESVVVTEATPTLTTEASDSVVVGSSVTDTALLSGGVSPTGTITFRLFGPDNATCAGAPAFTSTKNVSGNGAYVSDAFTATAPGTYRWIAAYSGDASNSPVSGACNDALESVVVSQATPTLRTTATTTVAVGAAVLDTATIAGGFNPTGTVTFSLFGPNNATCAGAPLFTSAKMVSGNGNYASDAFTTTNAGTYRWVAVYSGDANNSPVTAACNAANETTTVTPLTPTLSVAASPASVPAGTPLSASSILAGGFSPTGTLTFRLFGPSDATCAATPAGTSVRTVNGNTVYTSDALSPPGSGTYRWAAAYSGDANNAAVTTTCTAVQVVGAVAPSANAGYWLTGGDGGIFAFGGAGFFGSLGALRLNQPIVTMAPTASGRGYWLTASDGGVFALGEARFFGSLGGLRLNQPIVAMAPTPTGRGYLLAAADGGVFALGDAVFRGSLGAIRLNQRIVGMAATPTGRGYWLVGADGGVFAFGDATFAGSLGAIRLNQRIVAMAPTPTGRGYWLVGADGGIFAFGDAVFFGSLGASPPGQPIVGITASSTGRGYWLAGSRGGVYAFGDAVFAGSAATLPLKSPIAAIAARA